MNQFFRYTKSFLLPSPMREREIPHRGSQSRGYRNHQSRNLWGLLPSPQIYKPLGLPISKPAPHTVDLRLSQVLDQELPEMPMLQPSASYQTSARSVLLYCILALVLRVWHHTFWLLLKLTPWLHLIHTTHCPLDMAWDTGVIASQLILQVE